MQRFFKILTFSFLGLSMAQTAKAAGYQLNEYSAASMGRSFAGLGVVGDDFSAIGYNPAGMSLNKKNGIQGNASLIRLYSHFKGNDGAGREGRGHTTIERLIPSFFAQHRYNDQITTGIGVYVPFGLATDYPNGWFGERHGALSEITVVNISPAVAYRFNDYLSVGGSVNFQYADAHLTSQNSDLGGNDLAMGYSLGMTVSPLKQLRFGLSYRSKVSHHLKGDLDRLSHPMLGTVAGRVGAKITTPETALLSGAWDITDKWTLSGTARWTRWKRFNNLDIDLSFNSILGPMGIRSSTSERWRNTGFYALGLDYKANKNWTIRGGIGYDMTVIRSEAHRTPRIPDGRRVWNGLGFSYLHENLQFDAGYAHIFVYGGHAKGTDSTNIPAYPNIKYSSDANMFSLGFQYKF